ncbi:hypothetical protein CDAR_315971 [Caerostris darwini]|uniref:Uncharacterized protein n=1 Tax=Caerostris darwini TaxID=1538125 RepID=A0AAV4MDY2_9ARAC|nr:hypothetical protein CDAR_315971 [Caerostris darwini]
MSREDITPLTPKALQVSLPIESEQTPSSFWKKKLLFFFHPDLSSFHPDFFCLFLDPFPQPPSLRSFTDPIPSPIVCYPLPLFLLSFGVSYRALTIQPVTPRGLEAGTNFLLLSFSAYPFPHSPLPFIPC